MKRLIAGGTAILAMIAGCFLDSASWVPTIAMTVLLTISAVLAYQEGLMG